MTYRDLVEKYRALNTDDVIIIDSRRYKVVSNRIDDFVYLSNMNDENQAYHLFYTEMDPSIDNFIRG